MDGRSRRNVLDLAIKSGLAVCVGGMAVPVVLYLAPAGSRGPKEGLYDAGPADTFEPGTARLIQGDGRPILVVCLERGRYLAVSAICTHLGCVVKWDGADRKILCPCHAGVFAPDGKVLSGPPSRALPAYEVLVAGNDLKVRT